ncbi:MULTISPECIES: TetR/AcrR family transcriptional regulator [unclassified Amycolatopsis]|uniref:TetR/AcrR family transcriptional regulator n=1 Tax=unclassified Amycolatopsis TaxID=2618356 RepID=UPI002E1CFDC3|nr:MULTISPECIES: TetR/AcrR family transcriptional regulator [unclassified Amycolatopsis]
MTDEQDRVVRRRGPRRDAADNRDRVLVAAAAAVRRDGIAVPMATIAADAGVGVGTVYRHYPSRDALLGALTHRSFRLVLETARRAAALDGPAIDGIRFFLEQTIEHGSDLVLPMHGGPAPSDAATVALRDEAHRTLGSILERGQDDGTLRSDVTRADIVSFGALLAQGLPHVPDWQPAARRQTDIYLDGLLKRGR